MPRFTLPSHAYCSQPPKVKKASVPTSSPFLKLTQTKQKRDPALIVVLYLLFPSLGTESTGQECAAVQLPL